MDSDFKAVGYRAGVKVLPTVRNTVAKPVKSIPGVVQMTTEAIGEKTGHGAIQGTVGREQAEAQFPDFGRWISHPTTEKGIRLCGCDNARISSRIK